MSTSSVPKSLEPLPSQTSSVAGFFDTVIQDVRFGVRLLLRSPVFTIVATITLAIGIGANTAVFSITDQLLLRTLPADHPEELTILRSPGPNPGFFHADNDISWVFSYPMYKDLREQNKVFSGLLARFALPLSVTSREFSERARGELVSGNYFNVLKQRPSQGRVFSPADESAPGANPVAVLSHPYWMHRFGGDSSVVNTQINVNGVALTIVGIAGEQFTGMQTGQPTDIFIPVTMKARITPHWDGLNAHDDHWLVLMGRLRPNVSLDQAYVGLQRTYSELLQSELPLLKVSEVNKPRFLAR